MPVSRSTVEAAADEYGDVQPLAGVEREHLDMLPETLRGGDYGWRDVEWIVQWYYRRFLGAYPDANRRSAEESFRDNEFEAVLAAVDDALAAEETDARIGHLTSLEGVGVPAASAFLQFLFPDRYVVVDRRSWTVLRESGELDGAYPDGPTVEDYLAFDAACRDLRDRLGVDAWTLYRALWVLGRETDLG